MPRALMLAGQRVIGSQCECVLRICYGVACSCWAEVYENSTEHVQYVF